MSSQLTIVVDGLTTVFSDINLFNKVHEWIETDKQDNPTLIITKDYMKEIVQTIQEDND